MKLAIVFALVLVLAVLQPGARAVFGDVATDVLRGARAGLDSAMLGAVGLR